MHDISLRNFISAEMKIGNVINVKKRVSCIYQASAILKKLDGGPIVYFEDLEGFRAVGNVVSTRDRLYRALNVSEENYHKKISKALSSPIAPTIVGRPKDLKITSDVDLNYLPILKHFKEDRGRYITASIVTALSVDGTFQNSSVHRILVLDKDKATLRIVPRHLHAMVKEAEDKGRKLNVAITIGTHPAVIFSASCSPPYKVDHLAIANNFLNGHLKVFKTSNGITVPIDSEIVLEGYIDPTELVEEGPFTDLTGTPDVVRYQPALYITKMYLKEDFIYQTLLPSGREHMLLMGLSREAMIKSYVERVVPYVKKVRLSIGGCGWLHAVVSIRKVREGDGKNVIMASFAAHPSLKLCIVVDEDIDPDDPFDVEWALATRFQADKDLIIIKNATTSSLDPSADQQIGLGCKLGIDATRSLNKPPEHFRRSTIPVSEGEIEKLLGENNVSHKD